MKLSKISGVVSQQIACEMKLASIWESTLECIQYFTMAVGIIVAGLLAERLVNILPVSNDKYSQTSFL